MNEELKTIEINNNILKIKEWNGQRVLTFKDIDNLHNRAEGTAKRNFNDNQKRFIENKDYYLVSRKELRQKNGCNDKPLIGNPNIKMVLLTASGYLLLVKSFTDDLAWNVQKELKLSYFVTDYNTNYHVDDTELETVEINNEELQIKEWNDQRVVTLADIDRVHGRPDGTARRNFNTNKKHLIDGEDYIVLNSYEAKEEYGIKAPNGLTLLTESGYLLLVKSFTDELAWNVQREIVDFYFRHKNEPAPVIDNKTADEIISYIDKSMETLTNRIDTILNNAMNDTFEKYLSSHQFESIAQYKNPSEYKVSDDENTYKNYIYELCDIISSNCEDFSTSKEVLSYCYKEIRRKHGVVWEKEKSDFINEFGYYPSSVIAMIAKIGDDRQYKSILQSMLENMADKYRAKSTIQLAKTWEDAQNLIPTLANKLNDNSPYNAVTYSKLYKLMGDDINWTYYKMRCKKKNHITAKKAAIPKKEIIRCSTKLQNMFVSALNTKLQEV